MVGKQVLNSYGITDRKKPSKRYDLGDKGTTRKMQSSRSRHLVSYKIPGDRRNIAAKQ
jgi:hypothetical protein